MRMFTNKSIATLIFAITAIFVAKLVFADWNYAHWYVWNGDGVNLDRDKGTVEIVNRNKLSFRSYGFNRNTGSLKWIKFNVSQLDDERIYVYGESSFTVFIDGVEQKSEFVSFDAQKTELNCNAEERRGSDVLAIATSRYRLPVADVDVFIVYRFRRDNEVKVDCVATTKRQLPVDANISISYPVRNEYVIDDQRRDVYKIKLYRDQADRMVPLCFRSRASIGRKSAKKMSVAIGRKDNALSPYHNRVITLSSSLHDPIKTKDCFKTADDQWLYSFCFSIPLYFHWYENLE